MEAKHRTTSNRKEHKTTEQNRVDQIKSEQKRAKKERVGWDKTGQQMNRKEHKTTDQNRAEHNKAGEKKISTILSKTGRGSSNRVIHVENSITYRNSIR